MWTSWRQAGRELACRAARHRGRRGPKQGRCRESPGPGAGDPAACRGSHRPQAPCGWGTPGALRSPDQRRAAHERFTRPPLREFREEASAPWGCTCGSLSHTGQERRSKRVGVTVGAAEHPQAAQNPGGRAGEPGSRRESLRPERGPVRPHADLIEPWLLQTPGPTRHPDGKGTVGPQGQAAASEAGDVSTRQPGPVHFGEHPEPHRPRGSRRTQVA